MTVERNLTIRLEDPETFESYEFSFMTSTDKHRMFKQKVQEAAQAGKPRDTISHNYVLACVDKDQKAQLAALLNDEDKGVDLADVIVQRLLEAVQTQFRAMVKKPNPSATTSTLTD